MRGRQTPRHLFLLHLKVSLQKNGKNLLALPEPINCQMLLCCMMGCYWAGNDTNWTFLIRIVQVCCPEIKLVCSQTTITLTSMEQKTEEMIVDQIHKSCTDHLVYYCQLKILTLSLLSNVNNRESIWCQSVTVSQCQWADFKYLLLFFLILLFTDDAFRRPLSCTSEEN